MADTEKFDPQAAAQRLMSVPGLQAMQLLINGQHDAPSIAKTLGFTLAEVEDGKAVFVGEPSDRILNPLGIVHGGWALTLIDSCTGCAAHTTLPAGVGYTTVETKVNFVRAITPATGQVRAEGRVVARGRTIITAEGTLTDSNGKLLAHGTSTLMVLRPSSSEARG
jgi:uncharacterized protein (TIGR00369 family)